MGPKIILFSSEEIALLRKRFEKLDEVTSFETDVELASRITSYGIFREIGTVNDELARFIFDSETAKPVRLESLKAELIEWNGLFGLRVFSTDSRRLELRTKGFYEVVHPHLSKNEDGSLHSLYIFPQIVNEIAKGEGVELVLVKSWGVNSIFGGFDPSTGYYQTNFWEIENNDALKFADLVRQGRVAFMGTHDLVAHVAGIDRNHWLLLKRNAERAYEAIYSYFKSAPKPSISALILPYTIGVVLDDLAQPPSYSSKNHIAVLDELLWKISRNEIPANLPTLLTQFPESFQKIIDLSRTSNIEQNPTEIKTAINDMVREILNASLVNPA
ncbi:MAG: hypothetical protein IPM97_15740 [Bdellovibrionaceae bacterium]|nr:hypothetical protein [Pseudobdellovibrionaceae bacterium]